jgi:hypothetical protein
MLATQQRFHFPRDRWHSAIIIQAAMRRALCRMHMAARLAAARLFVHQSIVSSLQNEACLMIQTQYRRHRARRVVAALRKVQDDAARALGVHRSVVPELFSAHDIPSEMLDFSRLLRVGGEERFALEAQDEEEKRKSGKRIPEHLQTRHTDQTAALSSSSHEAARVSAGPAAYDDLLRSPLVAQRIHAIFDYIDRHRTGMIDQRYCVGLAERLGGGGGGSEPALGGKAETLQALRGIKGGRGAHQMPEAHLHIQLNRAEFFEFMTLLIKK